MYNINLNQSGVDTWEKITIITCMMTWLHSEIEIGVQGKKQTTIPLLGLTSVRVYMYAYSMSQDLNTGRPNLIFFERQGVPIFHHFASVDVYARQTLPDRLTVDVSHGIWCSCVWTGWRLFLPCVARHIGGWQVFTHRLSRSPWDVTLGYPTTSYFHECYA